MADQVSGVKMVPVDSKLFESVGYVTGGRLLYIKFRNTPGLCFNAVPSFRFEGLLGAPRKDAYYQTFIQNKYITKEVTFAPPAP
jgi:hypothetical protein